MSSSAPFDIGNLIEATPGVYGGSPCLAGTRFPVLHVAAEFRAGRSAAEIVAAYEGLDLPRVHAGLAYYFANQELIDSELESRGRENAAAIAAGNFDKPSTSP